jgi:endonuclease/exonuclease/phosphatase (EEP) superfamily protein YafD
VTQTEVTPRTLARRRARRARTRRHRAIGITAQVAGGAVVLGVLAGVLSGGQWPWVIATYARWPQTVVAIVAAAVLLRLGWWRTGTLLALVAAALVGSVVGPLRALDTVEAPPDQTLRIAVHNTGFRAGDVAAFADAIRAAEPDLVVLLESEDIAEQLDARLDGVSLLPTPGPGGRDTAPPAVLARRPWRTEVVPLAGERPATIVTADIAGQPVDVVAIHPLPPMTAAWAASHQRSITALVDEVLPRGRPHVVACDCNTTPWSPSMRRLLDTDLREPTVVPTFGLPLLGIPVDHVLLSPSVAAVSRELGAFNGSDHRMIVTDVTVTDEAAAR